MGRSSRFSFLGICALGGLGFLTGCSTDFTAADTAYFQPPITATSAPTRPLRESWSLHNNTRRVGLSEMRPMIPAFNGQGALLASWNPYSGGASGRPSFIVIHGGHGLVPTNFATALWLRDTFGANVLLLDSYWSRGREENWATGTRYGVNMRVLDVIAAGRWLRDSAGADPQQSFLVGDSQGGWTVLRSFTTEAFFQRELSGLLRAGVALYPNCRADGTAHYPRLGPYAGPVLIFTGGRDSATPITQCAPATLTAATDWIHFPDATHG
ncbi:MAG: dienelactone hydrolase [Alphaproteobacteria bacterium]|nr:dienelactone hydrolase [Alphaproteobacteria bacterium]